MLEMVSQEKRSAFRTGTKQVANEKETDKFSKRSSNVEAWVQASPEYTFYVGPGILCGGKAVP